MFGYVKVNKPELKIREFDRYKSYYCGLCQVLKKEYGLFGQLSLNYDITFLIIVLSALYECEDKVVMGRCKTHPVKKIPKRTNEITEYAAAMNVLLTYYHLDDNWKDEKDFKSLAYKEIIRRGVVKAAGLYPKQASIIKKQLKKLSGLEKKGCTNIDELASCFGTLMAGLFAYRQDVFAENLKYFGFYLGKFIYIMDAYDDVEKDIKNNSFNPLKDMKDNEDFHDFVRNALNIIMADCCSAFEMLPVIQDEGIIKNILYAGVWQRYNVIYDAAKTRREDND